MKAVLEREKLRAQRHAFGAQKGGMRARQLERGLPRLGAGVAQEYSVEASDLREAQRELSCAAMVEEIRRVDELRDLVSDGAGDGGMVVA